MAKLSDFQAELVQLGAVLNGDHALADEYPERLAKRMTVADGARYVRSAFKAFLKEGERCQKEGVDGSHVVEVVKRPTSVKEDDRAVAERKKPATTFFRKVFSCVVCNTSQESN